MRLDYVIRYVQDVRRSVAFYRDVLDLEVRLEREGYAELATENLRFGLYERRLAAVLLGCEPGQPGPDGEIVFLVEDVNAWAERLRDAGVTILSGPEDRPWGHRTLHLEDPDGLIVELAQEIPRA